MCCYSDLIWNHRINKDQTKKYSITNSKDMLYNVLIKYELHNYTCITSKMYKYLQRDRVSFKKEIWFTLKSFSMSANIVLKWCTDLWNSFIIWQLRPKCSPFFSLPACHFGSYYKQTVLMDHYGHTQESEWWRRSESFPQSRTQPGTTHTKHGHN